MALWQKQKWPGGGFVDESIDGCIVISLMVTSLFLCGLYSPKYVEDVIKFYCCDTLRDLRHVIQRREGRKESNDYGHITFEDGHRKLADMGLLDPEEPMPMEGSVLSTDDVHSFLRTMDGLTGPPPWSYFSWTTSSSPS